MLILGQKKEPQKIVLREAVPPTKAVRQGNKIVAPTSEGEPEAFVVMAPITPAMRRRANHAYKRAVGDYSDPAELLQDMDRMLDGGEAYARELVRLGIEDWGGISVTGDEPVELTPDRETRFATSKDEGRPTGTIDLLLANDDLFETIANDYVRPDMQRQSEKNASSASPNGIGEAATRAKGTASSPARRKTRTAAAAATARTSSTRSPAKPAKRRGKR